MFIMTALLSPNMLDVDQGEIHLEVNGWNLFIGHSRHINIWYFFIKDRVKRGDLEIKYCPTEDIVANFFTKPLQGATFTKFRNQVVGFLL